MTEPLTPALWATRGSHSVERFNSLQTQCGLHQLSVPHQGTLRLWRGGTRGAEEPNSGLKNFIKSLSVSGYPLKVSCGPEQTLLLLLHSALPSLRFGEKKQQWNKSVGVEKQRAPWFPKESEWAPSYREHLDVRRLAGEAPTHITVNVCSPHW